MHTHRDCTLAFTDIGFLPFSIRQQSRFCSRDSSFRIESAQLETHSKWLKSRVGKSRQIGVWWSILDDPLDTRGEGYSDGDGSTLRTSTQETTTEIRDLLLRLREKKRSSRDLKQKAHGTLRSTLGNVRLRNEPEESYTPPVFHQPTVGGEATAAAAAAFGKPQPGSISCCIPTSIATNNKWLQPGCQQSSEHRFRFSLRSLGFGGMLFPLLLGEIGSVHYVDNMLYSFKQPRIFSEFFRHVTHFNINLQSYASENRLYDFQMTCQLVFMC